MLLAHHRLEKYTSISRKSLLKSTYRSSFSSASSAFSGSRLETKKLDRRLGETGCESSGDYRAEVELYIWMKGIVGETKKALLSVVGIGKSIVDLLFVHKALSLEGEPMSVADKP